MEVQELLRQYATGNRKFVLTSLRGVNLVGAYLAGVNLSRANLTEANLTRANLSQAVLVRANLTRANLRGANLAGADLRQANLTGAEISLEDLEPETYAGAILPDGQRAPLAPQPVATAATGEEVPGNVAALSDSTGTPTLSDSMPSEAPPQSPVPEAQSPQRAHSHRRNSWPRLPWLRIAAWATGYGFLGLFLFCLTAQLWAWPLVWLSSLVWVWQPVLLRSQPLLATVTVLLVTGISWTGLGLGIGLLPLTAVGLRLTGWTWQRALKLGAWLGGAAYLTVAVLPLLLNRQPLLQAAVGATPPLAVMILLGLLLSMLGLPAYDQLQTLNFSRSGIATALAMTAALGLAMGGTMGWLALSLV